MIVTLILAAQLVADSLPRPVVTLPEVRVTRERALSEARRRTPTAFVTDVDVAAGRTTLTSVPELLQQAASVRVVQYGGLGAFSTLSLRGAPPGQVSVYLDGLPLTSAAHGVANLSDLPATLLERIEVHRGLSPLGLGVATPGGAVNLVTGTRAQGATLRAAAGSFGTRETSGGWAGARGDWSALVHAGYQGSDGDFQYFDDNGTPQNPDDDETSTRVNGRFDATSALARVAWTPRAGASVSLRAEGFHRAQGVPGVGAVPALHPRLSFDRMQWASEARWAASDAAPSLTARASAQRTRSRFRDREAELGFGVQDTDERFRDDGASIEWASPAAWPHVSASAGSALRRERAEPSAPSEGLRVPPPSTRQSEAAWASVQLRLAGERVLIHGARRWDRQFDAIRSTTSSGGARASDRHRTLDTPQVGVRVALPLELEVRANWARAARAPGFLELFGNQGLVTGSPTLAPERGESWDAGGAWRGARGAWRASAEWAHFESLARDLIVFQRVGPTATRATNVARAALRGEELSARLAHPRLAISGASSWLSALQTEDPSLYLGRRLPQRPSRQSSLRADASLGPVGLSADVLHLGDCYLDPINFRRVPSRTLVGASASARWRQHRVALEGRNLGDRRAEDVGGFPLPGRTVAISFETRWAVHP